MENNRYLTAYDIAKILDVVHGTVYSWMENGTLEYSLVGRLRKVTKENLLKYLEKIGNSPGAMKDFKEDIDNFLKQKDEINKYLNEAKTDVEKIERYAEIRNYEKGTGPKVW